MNMFQISLDLIDSGATAEEAASRFREAYPNWPEYVAGWKAESILQMDAEILRNVVAGTSLSLGDPAAVLAIGAAITVEGLPLFQNPNVA